MADNQKPILIFPSSTVTSRSKLPSGFSNMMFPSAGRQGGRLGRKFDTLSTIFDSQNVELATSLNPIEPEKVLVLETIGSIDDLMNAVSKVDGLEWLVETAIDGVEPDEDFCWGESEKESKLQKKLYLIMANKRGLDQFVSLWKDYCEAPEKKLLHGLGKLKAVFAQLYDVRFWGVQDRLEESAWLEDWIETIKNSGDTLVNLQIELWFRHSSEKRNEAEEEIKSYIDEMGGSVLDSCVINEIDYHGILAQLPIKEVEELLSNQNAKLVKSEKIMFLRSTPQGFYEAEVFDALNEFEGEVEAEDLSEPKSALLDGLPLENHKLLGNKVTIDDWQEWSASTPVIARRHGTQMASTIIHGDLKSQDNKPLGSKLVITPILKSSFYEEFGVVQEETPQNKLEIDLIHIAIKRVIDNYPKVKIINLSYGDKTRAFYHSLSPLARLIDWLSFKHNILFIVSSGNYPLEGVEFSQQADDVLFKIHDDALNRKIMSPSESLNALTVGAYNGDSSEFDLPEGIDDLLNEDYFPSPFSATGLGFSNSVKPDILMPGGKVLFKKSLIKENEYELHGHKSENYPPGILTAVTSKGGQLSHLGYGHGTSFACALATRLATQIYEIIEKLSGEQLNSDYYAILIKAMLCHGSSWGEAKEKIYQIFKDVEQVKDRSQIKYVLSRIFGYGNVIKDKCLFSTDSRAFIVGTGEVKHEEAVIFDIPVPSSIIALRGRKRITVTLAWMSPLNPSDKRYRIAQLWFDEPSIASAPENREFNRLETEYRMSRRGTLQHEIFETESAIAFDTNDTFQVQVNCRQVAGKLIEPVKFAIAVSLEVEEALEVNIFNEIQTRLEVKVPVTA